MTTLPDLTSLLGFQGRLRLQEIVATLLLNGRALNSPLLVALGFIASKQSKGTLSTTQVSTRILHYCASYLNSIIRFKASKMVLRTPYLPAKLDSEPQTISTYLIQNPILKIKHPFYHLLMAQFISLAKFKKYHDLYHRSRNSGNILQMSIAVSLRTTLENMEHKQPTTPIQVDNKNAMGIMNNTVTQRKSKAIDRCLYWVLGTGLG